MKLKDWVKYSNKIPLALATSFIIGISLIFGLLYTWWFGLEILLSGIILVVIPNIIVIKRFWEN